MDLETDSVIQGEMREELFARILVPLDGSRRSRKAVEYAEEMARRFASEVLLLRVVQPASWPTPIMDIMPYYGEVNMIVESAEQQNKAEMSKAQRYVSRLRRALASQGISVSQRVVMGDPAESILRICRRERVELVVMTTHGRRGLSRALMGSVADEVLAKSGIPILVLRQQPGRK